MKPRFRFHDKVSDWQDIVSPPEGERVGGIFPASPPERERVAIFPAGHVAEADDAGNLHIYRKQYRDPGKTDVKVSGGVDDARPSRLRNALAELNRRNTEFYSRKEKP